MKVLSHDMNIGTLAQSWNAAIQPAGNLIDEPLGAIGVAPLREIPAALAWVYVKGAGNALRAYLAGTSLP
jgi:hypothetical protein